MTTGGNTGKGKLVTDGNGKPQTGVGKKGLLRKTASHRLPLTEGNGKKRGADVSRKATDDGGQKNNGKFTNGKSEKKNYGKNFTENNPSGHLYCACPCRTSALVTALKSSTVAYAQFWNVQKAHIQANLARKAQQEGQEEDELDSDARSVLAEELDDDEYREHEERRPVLQVLQLVKPVETRWNSTMFMIQRWVSLL